MNIKFEYNRIVKIGGVVSLAISGVLLPLCAILMAVDSFPLNAIVSLVFFGALVNLLLIQNVRAVITLREADFVYSPAPRSEIVYRYEDIARLEPKSIDFLGGWMNIRLVRGKPIHMPVNIKDCMSLIRSLKEKLDGLGLQDRYEEDKLFSYYRTLAYGEVSWGRMKSGWVPFILGWTLIAFSSALSYALWEDIIVFIVMIASLVIGLFPLFYDEYHVIVRRFKEQKITPEWKLDSGDPAEGKRLMIRSMIWFVAIQVIASLLQFFVF